jgi:hypothetical protein
MVGGVRTFQWVLVPRQEGMIEIPAVQYAWFDPFAEAYRTASTEPVQLSVTPPATVATVGGDTTLAPLRRQTSHGFRTLARSPWFFLAQLLPLLALAALALVRRSRSGRRAATRDRRSRVNDQLAALDACVANDPRTFHATAITLLGELRDATHDIALHERCDRAAAHSRAALYAPEPDTPAARQAALAEIRSIADHIVGKRASHRARTSPVVILLVLAGIANTVGAATAATAATAASADAGAFERGIAAYESGDYRAAAQAFTLHAERSPADAAGWYDLGNAQYRLGDPGRAVWAWLKAAQLEPRSTDVAHNLQLVRADRAAAEVQHWFPISSAELAWLAALCWWLSLMTAAAWLIRPRNGLRIAGLLLATACATSLIMLGARWAQVPRVVPFGHGTTMFAAPTTRTDVRGQFEPGDVADVVREQDGWLLVRTPDLREGWVQTDLVGRL